MADCPGELKWLIFCQQLVGDVYDLESCCVLSIDINIFTCQSYNVSYNIPLGVACKQC